MPCTLSGCFLNFPCPVLNHSRTHRTNTCRWISIVAILLGLTFLGVGLGLGVQTVVQSLVYCISVIVATVPEGLLCTLTVALALTAKRMHNVSMLVKNLQGVETLGCTTVIASDKTGTLTQNRMTVQHCWWVGGWLRGCWWGGMAASNVRVQLQAALPPALARACVGAAVICAPPGAPTAQHLTAGHRTPCVVLPHRRYDDELRDIPAPKNNVQYKQMMANTEERGGWLVSRSA
jgi:uncharacterized membrane protein YhaH (DUF805 family)